MVGMHSLNGIDLVLLQKKKLSREASPAFVQRTVHYPVHYLWAYRTKLHRSSLTSQIERFLYSLYGKLYAEKKSPKNGTLEKKSTDIKSTE